MKHLMLCFFLLASNCVWADGILKQVSGTVTINAATAQIGDSVPAGAVLQTGAQSRASIQFDDGHTLLLGSESRLQVQNYTFLKNEPAKDRMALDMTKGTLRSISGALGERNPSKFSLSTPTASAAIQGTDFLTSIVDYLGQDAVTRQQTFFTVTHKSVI